MVRRIVVVLLSLMYAVLLFLAVVAGTAGFGFWFDALSASPEAILAGLQLTSWFGIAMIPVVLLRWWLKSITWGTFFVLAFVLAVGSFHAGTYFSYLEYVREGRVSYAYAIWFWALAAALAFACIVFLIQNARHVRSAVEEARSRARPRR